MEKRDIAEEEAELRALPEEEGPDWTCDSDDQASAIIEEDTMDLEVSLVSEQAHEEDAEQELWGAAEILRFSASLRI